MNRRPFCQIFRAAFATVFLLGCHGAVFNVEAPLSETPKLVVVGGLGLNGARCPANDPQHPPAMTQGIGADQEAEADIGSFRAKTNAPHREITNATMFKAAVLSDYEKFVREHPMPERDVTKLELGMKFILLLPAASSETITFTFSGEHDHRFIWAACTSVDRARLAGYFDGPHFSMTCRIVSSADGVPHDLVVRGYGTWANATFRGELRTPSTPSSLLVAQNESVMGMGAVRGFEVRDPTQRQVAAVSFFDHDGIDKIDNVGQTILPAAWVLPRMSKGWEDTLYATLFVAYVFPWPTSCDQQAIRGQGLQESEKPVSDTPPP